MLRINKYGHEAVHHGGHGEHRDIIFSDETRMITDERRLKDCSSLFYRYFPLWESAIICVLKDLNSVSSATSVVKYHTEMNLFKQAKLYLRKSAFPKTPIKGPIRLLTPSLKTVEPVSTHYFLAIAFTNIPFPFFAH